jgi:NADP-dependent 3-hydroxy acid dehydrogenase YdfG
MGATITETFTKRGLTVYGVARKRRASRRGGRAHGHDPAHRRRHRHRSIDRSCGASADSVDAMVDVNLRAVLHLCRLLLPGMIERDLGHIVNISSIAGLYNFYGHTAYHATKAAVHQLSRQLRNDTIGKRVRVTEICPGRVETEIFGRNLGGTPEAMQTAWDTYYEGLESITTKDIADTIEYAIEAPRHVNLGLIEIMPTFQVPGGLDFIRRND